MISLVRMELLKLTKRPLTWILLLLLLGGFGFGVTLNVLSLRGAGPEVRARILDDLTLPGALPETTSLISIFGAIMLSILAAATIGSEYSWGTLRPMLAIGMPRERFLGAKISALALVVLAFVVLPLLLVTVLAVPIAIWQDRPIMSGTVDLAWIGALAALVGRTYLLVLVPTLIAFLVGLVGRSQAAGIGVALGLMVGEQIVTVLLARLGFGWVATAIDFFPRRVSQMLAAYYNVLVPVALPPGVLGEWRLLLTLGTYVVVCLAVSFLVFRRRDIRGAA